MRTLLLLLLLAAPLRAGEMEDLPPTMEGYVYLDWEIDVDKGRFKDPTWRFHPHGAYYEYEVVWAKGSNPPEKPTRKVEDFTIPDTSKQRHVLVWASIKFGLNPKPYHNTYGVVTIRHWREVELDPQEQKTTE